MLVITRLSRAMRSLKHLLALAGELRERGAGLVVLKQQIDTTTPQGRLVFHLLGAIDEFQRELIIEGTREGLDAEFDDHVEDDVLRLIFTAWECARDLFGRQAADQLSA